MKKVLFFVCAFICVATAFLFSCNKENQLNPRQVALVDKAKDWYNANLEKSLTIKADIPMWQNAAVIKTSSGEQLIVVPVSKQRRSNNPKFGLSTSYVFSTNGDNIKTGNIIRVIGEADFIEGNGQKIASKFKNSRLEGLEYGAILTYDINNRLLQGHNVENGQVQLNTRSEIVQGNLIRSKKTSGSVNSSPQNFETASDDPLQRKASTFATQGEGICTDWYLVTYNTSTGELLSSSYAYTTCEPTSGGGTGSDAWNNNATVIKVDCKSFVFLKTTPSNWQEAGVNKIRLKWVWIGSGSGGLGSNITREMYANNVVFGLPTYYTNADGTTTTLTPGQAANKAAQILEAAKIQTYRHFNDIAEFVREEAVILYFKERIQILMATQMGTAGATGTGSPNIIFRDEDRSNWTDPFDC